MKYKRVKYIRWAVLLLLLAGVGMCAKMPGAGEWYAREVYPYVSVMLSGVASVVPFSAFGCGFGGAFLVLRSHGIRFCSMPDSLAFLDEKTSSTVGEDLCKGSRDFALGVCLVLLGLGHELFS